MSAPNETSMASPFAPKLGTNYCPLDDEVLQIRALLTAPLSRLKQIDDQIAELQKAIDELVEERERVRSFVDPHKDLISPLRRLPLDVVQEIFVACLPAHRNCVMTAREAPVLLGRVCSAWRSISLGTPRLWARLHIVEPSLSSSGVWSSPALLQEKLAQRLETAKTWLGRSAQCPLSISFQGTHDPPPQPDVADPPANTQLFVDVMVSVAARWEDITLCASPSTLAMFSSLTEHDVPMLQKFKMSTVSGTGPQTGRPNFSFLGAPRLKDFTVAAGATQNVRELPVRWQNLTHLRVMGFGDSSFSCSGVLELLAKCSQLQECWLQLDHPDSLPEIGSANSSIQLPFLQSFYMSSLVIPVDDVGKVFRRLSLPQLRHLDLRRPVGDSDLQDSPLVGLLLALLAVSPCFESLTIDTQYFTGPSLAELLRGLPATTTSLRIIDRLKPWNPQDLDGILDDAVITVLTPTPEHPGSCPALQELVIAGCAAPSDTVLLQFLKARMTAPANQMRKVKIKFHRERQFDIFPEIQSFLNDGRIKVSTIYSPHHKTVGDFSPWEGLPDAPETNGWTSTEDEFDLDFV
ncbi:hypothetical protein C8R46DRAFT_1187254 [Mycena filopes]|nr:hypothetical protein C8R46DRAFT_1187254 [Mycena filopes]